MSTAKHVSTKETPATEPILGRSDMVKNSAGGFVFSVDLWKRLDRFLILGTEGGTYYASEREVTVDNAKNLIDAVKADGKRFVKRVVEISDAGRAPKNDPAIMALAMAMTFGDAETKQLAKQAVTKVCRIGTHIFQFAEAVQNLRGWGHVARRGVESWYRGQSPDQLAMNVIKYANRNGWTHKDLLRQAHVRGNDREALFRWITCDGDLGERKVLRFRHGTSPAAAKAALEHFKATGEQQECVLRVDTFESVKNHKLPDIIEGYEAIKKVIQPSEAVQLIEKYGLPREVVPTELLNSKEVWASLLVSGKGMPITALIRNLGKMTNIGLVSEGSDYEKYVIARLTDREALKRGRVHPITILLALSTYSAGRGVKGQLSWQPSRKVVTALDDAFYASFAYVEPTGKRRMFALDVSGSMHGFPVNGTHLTAAQVSAAMALVTAKTEKEYAIFGFGSHFAPLPIKPDMRLEAVLNLTRTYNFGGTDCALPMRYAMQHKLPFDSFEVWTDSETWAGGHPAQAVQQYRAKMGIAAKLAVCGTTSTEFTIADPNDAGMLDLVGFDSAIPQILADFIRE